MTKQEFEQAIVLEWLARRECDLVYSIHVNFKVLYIQVLETQVNIMMNDFNNTKASYTYSVNTLDTNGKADFDKAYTKLESMINE
jgi:hypothetical protein